VVTANYYHYGLNKDQIKGLKGAIAQYNNGGKAFSVKTAQGTVFVKYNLSATEVKDAKEASAKMTNDQVKEGNNVYGYGNSVTSGSAAAGSEDMGSSDSRYITLDQTKTEDYAKGTDLESQYEATSVHEIGHNLAGNHGDPGLIMINPTRTEEQRQGCYGTDCGSGVYHFTLGRVTKDGVRAMIGRLNMPYNSIESRYLTDKETQKVNEAAKRGKDAPGTGGKIMQISTN